MNVYLVAIASYLGLTQGVLLTSLPMLLNATGLSTAQLGLVVAVGSGLFLIGNPFWGWLSDRWCRRRVLLIGVLGYVSSHAWMGWAVFYYTLSPTETEVLYGHLLAARALYGLTCSSLYPVLQAWAIDNARAQQQEASVALVSAGVNTGRALGPVLALALLWLSPEAPFIGLALLALPAIFLVVQLPHAKEHRREITKSGGEIAPLLTLLLVALLLTTLMGCVQYTLGFALQAWFDGSAQLASRWLAGILVTTAVVSVGLQLGILHRLKRLWLWAVPLAISALMVSCVVLLLAKGVFWWLLACVLLGLAVATLVPAYLGASGRLSRNRGAVAGYFGVFHTLGHSFGPLLAGSLLINGVEAVFVLTLGLGCVVAGLMAWQRHQFL